MSTHAPAPRLDVVVRALTDVGARFVLVGGFAVIAHRYVRATEDSDFLVPTDDQNDRRVVAALSSLKGVRARDDAPVTDEQLIGAAHLRARTEGGLVDILREGLPPLDFDTVSRRALHADYGGGEFLIAGLASLVGFKRLSDRPRDRLDLEALAEIHGELPIEPLPGLDE